MLMKLSHPAQCHILQGYICCIMAKQVTTEMKDQPSRAVFHGKAAALPFLFLPTHYGDSQCIWPCLHWLLAHAAERGPRVAESM